MKIIEMKITETTTKYVDFLVSDKQCKRIQDGEDPYAVINNLAEEFYYELSKNADYDQKFEIIKVEELDNNGCM